MFSSVAMGNNINPSASSFRVAKEARTRDALLCATENLARISLLSCHPFDAPDHNTHVQAADVVCRRTTINLLLLIAGRVRCDVPECTVKPNYGFDGEAPRFCAAHKQEGMQNLSRGRCKVKTRCG